MSKALVPSDTGTGGRWGRHMGRTKVRRQWRWIGRLRLSFYDLLVLCEFGGSGIFFILEPSHFSFPIFFVALVASDSG
jgi:hypothetical protein